MTVELERLLVTPESPIREVMACIDRSAKGIALVVDEERRLIATITDGDVRRAILAGIDLDLPVRSHIEQKASSSLSTPITAPVGTSDSELLRTMNEYTVRQIPLVDEDRRVVGVALLSDLVENYELPLRAVIMAGGDGTRLRPLTERLPKPMLPVGGRPLMEIIIQQLRDAGIKHVNITTHYKPDKITQHFGDGKEFGVEIGYVTEDRPLGTAGALGLMEPPHETLLVINGDILTQVNFSAMLAFHREHGADLTVAVRQYDLQVPYGVIECDGSRVRRLTEKPVLDFFINAGIYLLEPSVHRYIPNGEIFAMTDLIQNLINEGRLVIGFPICEYWLDIGQHADYEQAQQQVKSWKSSS